MEGNLLPRITHEADKKLTKRQLLFVDEYLKDMNGYQAAIRAGYSHSRAKQADTMLRNSTIKELIANAMKARQVRVQIDQDQVIYNLEDMIKYNAEKIIKGGENNMYEEMRNAPVALKALELLGKHFGMFKEGGGKNEITVLLRDYTGNKSN